MRQIVSKQTHKIKFKTSYLPGIFKNSVSISPVVWSFVIIGGNESFFFVAKKSDCTKLPNILKLAESSYLKVSEAKNRGKCFVKPT